ncbi:MAG: hypothetical protein JO055_16610, partial [Alphaproteobacteria bacterium]|nr:hypothetical protein [Alphaproteobacteria bacterium]
MSFARLSRIARTAAFRLTLAYAALFVVSAGVLFAGVYWIATAAMQADMTAVLRTEALQLSKIHAQAGLRGLAPEIARRMSFRSRGPIYYLLQAPDRTVIVGNLPGMVPQEGVIDLQRNLNEPDRPAEDISLTGFGLRLHDG